jgi:hypothetical protein
MLGMPESSDRPCLVKTHGSAHSLGNYYFSIAKSGLQIGARVETLLPRTRKADRR